MTIYRLGWDHNPQCNRCMSDSTEYLKVNGLEHIDDRTIVYSTIRCHKCGNIFVIGEEK